jgi:hypothetical protein
VATIIADNDETSFEVDAEIASPRFSWSAAVVGAVAALAVTALILLLGVGLDILSGVRNQGGSWTLTGAVYFAFSYAAGFCVGGYSAGRLAGVQTNSPGEEGFRIASHGLVVWGVVATVWALAFTMVHAVSANALTGADTAPTSYWVDVLFRPQASNNRRASLDGVQFAQADTGQSTDGTPSAPPSLEAQPPPQGAEELGNTPNSSTPNEQDEKTFAPRNVLRHAPGDLAPQPQPPSQPSPEKLAADKSEVARMIDADMILGGYLTVDDRDRAAQLIAQDATLSYEDATTRVNAIQGRIRTQRDSAATMLRREESVASLWLAFSLLLGAGVSVFAALFAQRRHDLRSMLALVRQPR